MARPCWFARWPGIDGCIDECALISGFAGSWAVAERDAAIHRDRRAGERGRLLLNGRTSRVLPLSQENDRRNATLLHGGGGHSALRRACGPRLPREALAFRWPRGAERFRRHAAGGSSFSAAEAEPKPRLILHCRSAWRDTCFVNLSWRIPMKMMLLIASLALATAGAAAEIRVRTTAAPVACCGCCGTGECPCASCACCACAACPACSK